MRLILTALCFVIQKGGINALYFLGHWCVADFLYNAIKVICLFIICMTTFIAYANIQQPFLFDEIPTELVSENLRIEPRGILG